MRSLLVGLSSIIVSLMLIGVFAPSAVNAASIFSECQSKTAGTSDVCRSIKGQGNNTAANNDPILKILKTVITVISYIIGVAAIIVLIIAGLSMIVGGGNPQNVSNARNMIIYALIGIAVAVLAQTIVVFVLKNVA